ncbi:MAG TPA: hypothetical protein VKR99_06360 [Candidatus Eremiobacteraceae bacterium]|nr:hypothetical protein [Candidatus Eremiobacteraceae bacterium]
MRLKSLPAIIAVTLALAASIAATTLSLANPYSHAPKPGDQVRFDASSSGQHSAWAYPDQGWLETFLRASIDASLSGAKSDEQQPAVDRARQRSLAVDNGTQGLVGEVHPFRYRDHDDTEVQVLIKQGPLRNHVYWTTAAELADPNGRKYLK